MRKVLILAGLLLGGALLTGSPAQAALGCQCVKLGAPSMCTATVTACNFGHGGVCIAPCDYSEKTGMKKGKKKKKM